MTLRQDAQRSKARRQAVKAWGASRKAEAQYVQAIGRIMATTHAAVLKVVERERLSKIRADAAPAGLGEGLLRKIVRWQTPRIQTAFDGMASTADKKAEGAAALYGIRVRKVPGLADYLEKRRAENVDLVTRATSDFLQQIRNTLDEHEGEHVESIRNALMERVDVSVARATLIARDQSLKLASQLSQKRQTAAGVSRYRWSGSLDERERPMHRKLEGLVFLWEGDGPVTNEQGDHNHAGEDYQCRCVPLAVIAELEPDGEEPEPDEDPNAEGGDED